MTLWFWRVLTAATSAAVGLLCLASLFSVRLHRLRVEAAASMIEETSTSPELTSTSSSELTWEKLVSPGPTCARFREPFVAFLEEGSFTSLARLNDKDLCQKKFVIIHVGHHSWGNNLNTIIESVWYAIFSNRLVISDEPHSEFRALNMHPSITTYENIQMLRRSASCGTGVVEALTLDSHEIRRQPRNLSSVFVVLARHANSLQYAMPHLFRKNPSLSQVLESLPSGLSELLFQPSFPGIVLAHACLPARVIRDEIIRHSQRYADVPAEMKIAIHLRHRNTAIDQEMGKCVTILIRERFDDRGPIFLEVANDWNTSDVFVKEIQNHAHTLLLMRVLSLNWESLVEERPEDAKEFAVRSYQGGAWGSPGQSGWCVSMLFYDFYLVCFEVHLFEQFMGFPSEYFLMSVTFYRWGTTPTAFGLADLYRIGLSNARCFVGTGASTFSEVAIGLFLYTARFDYRDRLNDDSFLKLTCRSLSPAEYAEFGINKEYYIKHIF